MNHPNVRIYQEEAKEAGRAALKAENEVLKAKKEALAQRVQLAVQSTARVELSNKPAPAPAPTPKKKSK